MQRERGNLEISLLNYPHFITRDIRDTRVVSLQTFNAAEKYEKFMRVFIFDFAWNSEKLVQALVISKLR